MNRFSIRAKELRDDPNVHYNCAQSVLMAYAEPCGITEEKAHDVSALFGAGMKMGEVCGAITGGLMVLGLLGGTEEQLHAFVDAMREGHDGQVRCAELLQANEAAGGVKKDFCDDLVCRATELIAEIMHLA